MSTIKKNHIDAYVWWCGDYYCDCRQAKIERVIPRYGVGPPWQKREIIWKGTFYSGGEGEKESLDELKTACKERGIELDEDGTAFVPEH